MKPYTTTGMHNDEEDLRSNWRGNACSKHKDGTKPKGKISAWSDKKIGNNNYRRKKVDRVFKKRFRSKLLQQLKQEIKDLN